MIREKLHENASKRKESVVPRISKGTQKKAHRQKGQGHVLTFIKEF